MGTPPREWLVETIETSLHVLPPAPGVFDALPIPGVFGRVSRLSHPLANLVGVARFTEEDAAARVAEVRDLFGARGAAFGWVTGPATKPPDLARHLVSAGLVKVDEMAGMVLLDLRRPIDVAPGVRVREAAASELAGAVDLVAASYGLPGDVARMLTEAMTRSSERVRSRCYFAYEGEGREPIAWSSLVHIPDSETVLLGGAATLPEHRGKGAYTALVARRLADAHADGSSSAIIQAVRSTSAPVCARLGFEEVSALEMYAWSPPHEERSAA
ncbi:MAG: GNAT family N-acetyltransferase [Candidatus Limnocylindria bacterium]